MKLRLIVLMLCLAGNVLLATALIRHSRQAPPHPETPAHTPSKAVHQKKPAPTEIAADVAEAQISDFQWSQLDTPDYVVYIARLRMFDMPDTQVRDIIYGLVEAIYRPRRGVLRPPKKPDDGKFWVQHFYWGGVDSQLTKMQRDQMTALRKEESDLMKSLFGDDFDQQRAKDTGSEDWIEKLNGFIPKELRQQVQDINQRMNEDKQQIYADNEGYMDQDSQADLRKIEKKYHDEMAKILTPEQLMEWDLRNSDTANQLKNDLSAFDPNEDEFRALFQYKQAQEDLNPSSDPDSDAPQLTADQRQAIADKRKALDDQLAQTVGTNRVAEYKLEQDYAYRSLIDSGVPKESVFKLDEMKKQAEDAASKIRNDQSLSAEDRATALSAIRIETQNSINELLGTKPAKRYSGQGGWWLNNIAPITKP
ncbi:MAG: hypothetical protein WDM80_11575 [Limisphaerales bacterium]